MHKSGSNCSNALPIRARFLAHEEAAAAAAAAAVTGDLHAAKSGGARQPSLFQLYKWATRVAPKSNSPAYLALWLGYARQQGCAHGTQSLFHVICAW